MRFSMMLGISLLGACANPSVENASSTDRSDTDSAESCEEAMDRLVMRIEECGVDMGEDTGDEPLCDPEEASMYACMADCTEAAPCDVVNASGDLSDPVYFDDHKAYTDCYYSC